MGGRNLIWTLIRNGFRYRRWRRRGTPFRPQALSLEVTRRCVARCRMCSIWRTSGDIPELPLARWDSLLVEPALTDLRELDLTGGEPFLRDDLADLVLRAGELAVGHFQRLRTVAVTTNGVLTDRVLAATERMVAPLGRRGIDLVFACGCDAVGRLHDEVRGLPGSWDRLLATLQGLDSLRSRHPNLVLGIKVTVGPWNVGELDRLEDFAEERGLFAIVSPCIATANRYGNLDQEEAFRLTPDQKARFLAFLERARSRWDYHSRVLADYLRNGVVSKPCSAGFNYLFVRSDGEVFPCPLIPESVGNVAETSWEAILRSPELGAFRLRVGAAPECRTCTEPGLERFALPFEGFAYLRERLRLGAKAFYALHEHLGLNKYE